LVFERDLDLDSDLVFENLEADFESDLDLEPPDLDVIETSNESPVL